MDAAAGQGAAVVGRQVSYVDQSYRVFASPRLVRFYEMEYAIPREACAEALNRIRTFVEDERAAAQLPGRGALHRPRRHPAVDRHGRPSCYIAIHVFEGMEYGPYFGGVERIMDDYGGRPALGQAPLPDGRDAGAALPRVGPLPGRARAGSTPSGRFANDYTRKVLGA